MDTESNNRSYFEAKRQQSGNNDPQTQKIVQLLTLLVKGQSEGRQMDHATLSGIVSSVGSVLAGAVGGNPNFATQRFDTFYSAVRDSGPIHMYGRANNESGNMVYYGSANKPGNVTTNMADSLTGYINDFSSRGEHGLTGHEQRSMMTELISARIRKNGMKSTLIDWGKNGTAEELQRAYSRNVDAIGMVGTAQGNEMQDVIRARRMMNKKAYEVMTTAHGFKGALGEFDPNKEYWATKEFQSAEMAEDRKRIEADILENGIKDEKTGSKVGRKAASLAVRQSHGGFSSNIANFSEVSGMAEDLRPAMETLVKIQKQTGKTFTELNGFAAQLHMGSLANEKGMNNMKAFMARMEEIAAGTGRNVDEVFQEAQNVADSLGPQASGAMVAMAQRRTAQAVNDQNAAGEDTIYGVQATAQMAVQQQTALMGQNKGRAMIRQVLATTDVPEETRKQYEDMLNRLDNAKTPEEMARLNREADQMLRKNDVNTMDQAKVDNATRTYTSEEDLMHLSDLAREKNASDFAGGKGSSLTKELYGGMSKDAVEKTAGILYNLNDAIGTDDNGAKFKRLKELSKQLNGLGQEEKDEKLKSIGESGSFSEYELKAISDMSGMTDRQLMFLQNNYDTYSHGMSQHAVSNKSEDWRNRVAASDEAMGKRIDESVVGEEQRVGALDAFMNGAFGDAQLSEHDVTLGAMAQAEEQRNKLIASAQSDAEKEKFKSMSVAELLNMANSKLNVGGFNEDNIKQFKGALADGKLTQSFKDTLSGDSAFMDKIGGADKFSKMTDKEILEAYEGFHGGNIHFNANTGDATFFDREAVDKANSVRQAIRHSAAGKAAIKAYGNADTAAENVKFDHEGNLSFINVVADANERKLVKGEHGKLKAELGYSATDSTTMEYGAANLVKKSVDINELFSKNGGATYMSGGKNEILRQLGLTGSEARDKDGKKVDIETFFTKGEDGSYTGLSAAGVEFLSKRAAEYDQEHAKATVPPELLEAVNAMLANMDGMSSKLTGVVDGDAVKVKQVG